QTPAPVWASQTLISSSPPPVTIRDPSGLNDAEAKPLLCPLSVRSSVPVLASQTFADPSSPVLVVTTRDPSALNDAELIAVDCPLSVMISVPVLASQTFVGPLLSAVRTRDPSGLNDVETK